MKITKDWKKISLLNSASNKHIHSREEEERWRVVEEDKYIKTKHTHTLSDYN